MTQTAYITGTDRGLGLGLTQTLLEQEYRVFAGSYMPEWEELQVLKKKYDERLTILSLDVTDDFSVEKAAADIHSTTDHLNLLVNNAGTAIDRSGTILDKQYYDDIRFMMEVNAYGALRVTQSVLELLLKSRPKMLINISSLAGSVGLLVRTNQYGYTMSKAAINIQSKTIHNHFKDQGLKVRVLHPGWMRSHVFGDIERMKEAPLEPIDSARAIVKLIDDDTDVGDEIFVDYTGKAMPW